MIKFILIILFVVSSPLLAQSKQLNKANSHFSAFEYSKALKTYLKVEKKEGSSYIVIRRIADCYRLLHKYDDAITYYIKATDYKEVEVDAFLFLGRLLRLQNNYIEAAFYLNKFHAKANIQNSYNNLNPKQYLDLVNSDSTNVETFLLSINSNFSEFGPAIWKNMLVFSSNRPIKRAINRRDARNNKPFYNLFAAESTGHLNFTSPKLFSYQLQSDFNNGPVSFTPDEQTMYLTRNATSKRSEISELEILTTRFRNGEWNRTLNTLPLKKKGFSIAHAAITNDGHRLYFASDMPGGYGGMDLYYSDIRDGFLSAPINLGPNINTPGNEVFPFVDNSGKIYFASDGLPGLGGLDLFVTFAHENAFANPHNLGSGINSHFDDFSLTINEFGTFGYFTSDRPAKFKGDNIYAFKKLTPISFVVIKGITKLENSGEIAPELTIVAKKQENIPVAKFISNLKGNYSIVLLKGQKYTFTIESEKYEPIEITIGSEDIKDVSEYILNIELSVKKATP